MRRRFELIVVLVAGLVLAGLLAVGDVAVAEPAGEETTPTPAPEGVDSEAAPADAEEQEAADDPFAMFRHDEHRTRFLESRFSCLACHPIGMVTGSDDFEAVKKTDDAVLKPAREICHDCHTGAMRYKRATARCDSCHTDLAPLLPEDHGPGWERDHGWASMRHSTSCDLCHPVSDCNTCHARRDQGQHRVHPATFHETHGMEARMDPVRCQRCHLQSTCETCHATGSMR